MVLPPLCRGAGSRSAAGVDGGRDHVRLHESCDQDLAHGARALGAHSRRSPAFAPAAAGHGRPRSAGQGARIPRRRRRRGRAHRAGRRGSDRNVSRALPARRHRARQPAVRRRNDDLRRAVDGSPGRHAGRRPAVFAKRREPAAQRGVDRADHAHARRVRARRGRSGEPIGRGSRRCAQDCAIGCAPRRCSTRPASLARSSRRSMRCGNAPPRHRAHECRCRGRPRSAGAASAGASPRIQAIRQAAGPAGAHRESARRGLARRSRARGRSRRSRASPNARSSAWSASRAAASRPSADIAVGMLPPTRGERRWRGARLPECLPRRRASNS